MLKLTPKTCGYLKVSPVRNGENVHQYVHDLVADAFLGPKPNGADVNHIDGDKHNNVWTNLEYTTHAGNMAHASKAGLLSRGDTHHMAKITDAQVREIRTRRACGEGVTSMAREYGVSPATVSEIANGKKRKTA
jgi:hypothetical protein